MGRLGCYFRLFCSTLGVRCWMFGVRILFERGVIASEPEGNWRSPNWHGRRQFWIGRELREARWKREYARKKCHVTDGPVDATLRRMHIEMDFPESAFSALRLNPA